MTTMVMLTVVGERGIDTVLVIGCNLRSLIGWP